MKNDHHLFPHAFPVALWAILNPQGNASELDLNLDDIILPIPKKKVKFSRLAFSFVPNYSELEFF
jgi:hypothetical protein